MKTTAYVTHSDCSLHDPGWGHPEHQGRLPAVARSVYRDMLTLFAPLLELEAEPATEADLRLAHDSGYIERVRTRAADASAAGRSLALEGETLVSGGSWPAALAAVGAALTAVDAVMRGEVRNAFCAVRPPGHGAGRAGSSRYALFNPVAVAARAILRQRGVVRILVVDIGARFGAGTWELLRDDPAVAYVAIHGDPDAPVPGMLPAGASGADALAALQASLDSALDGFHPDFLLLSLGCDALASDPLGGLALDPADYHALTAAVRDRADASCGGRLVSVLEEGYDPAGMGRAVVQHLRALAGLPPA